MSHKRTTPLQKSSIEKHHCSVDVRLEKLGMVSFFRSLDPESLLELNKKFSSSHYSSGDTVYTEGEMAALLRVVVYGAVKLIRRAEDGKEILLDMLKPGEYFGSLSDFGHHTYTETATAQSDACILSIGNREIRSMLNSHPTVAVDLLDLTSQKLTSAREQIHHLTTLTVEKRIAQILKKLCEKFGEHTSEGMLLQLPLSRKDLADMAGTSAETASRIMSRFHQQGIITSGRQWVAITDMAGLSDVLSG
ncbi:MAG: Crp/Fnr family transcriptional regulator [Cyclonatronaceae bacterium]